MKISHKALAFIAATMMWWRKDPNTPQEIPPTIGTGGTPEKSNKHKPRPQKFRRPKNQRKKRSKK
ncbi:Uncharacterised protein [Neisseria animaloris]|uniref:hypothetical protein n=1 Tax=Neisseria animaloris TaxID=326522 RepID=UPI000A1924E7|nr:hypothetical protein [Neisseria animaloris]OSI06803.1 hypothetical protein BWD08_10600 [Neisseria animaloris]VEH86535.1 Uncharacterised protein [Neisseria animaloris]